MAANHNEKLFGYQYELFTKLVDRQFEAQFVGSFNTFLNNHVNDGQLCGTDPDVPCSTGDGIAPGTIDYPTFPTHNGHDYADWGGHKHLADGGATVAQVRAHLDSALEGWPRTDWSYTPDIALIHLGTNDTSNGTFNANSMVIELEQIVERIREKNSSMTVFVAKIIPRTVPFHNMNTDEFNSLVEVTAPGWSTADSEVIVADLHSGFVNPDGSVKTELLWDQAHPNRAGQQVMAEKWMEAIANWKGDLNGDNIVDVNDIDDLIEAMMDYASTNTVSTEHDLNLDGKNDKEDLKLLVKGVLQTVIGDSNLDGMFNSGDLVSVFEVAKFEQGIYASWAEGDWNGDGVFDSADLVFAFEEGDFDPN